MSSLTGSQAQAENPMASTLTQSNISSITREILGVGFGARGRCDSSDCLYCQYRGDDCILHSSPTSRRLGGLLRSRASSVGMQAQACMDEAAASATGNPADTTLAPAETRTRLRRQRTSSSSDGSLWLPSVTTNTHSSSLVQFADLTQPQGGVSQDMIGALEFSPDGHLLASGSMAKQVRLYNLSDVFEQWQGESSLPSAPSPCSDPLQGDSTTGEGTTEDDIASPRAHDLNSDQDEDPDRRSVSPTGHRPNRLWTWNRQSSTEPLLPSSTPSPPPQGPSSPSAFSPVVVHRLPSKVSCLAWVPNLDGVISVGDYDGVITQLHVGSGHQLTDVDAHEGRRIWGITYSKYHERVCASVADDGTARLWSGTCLESCVAVIRPPQRISMNGSTGGVGRGVGTGGAGALCGVDFSPAHPHLLALASADHNVYLHDIRAIHAPLMTLRHHKRPVAYVRFLGPSRLVSSSTDASLAVWDINSNQQLVMAMDGNGGATGDLTSHAINAPGQHPVLQHNGSMVRLVEQQLCSTNPAVCCVDLDCSHALPSSMHQGGLYQSTCTPSNPWGSQGGSATVGHDVISTWTQTDTSMLFDSQSHLPVTHPTNEARIVDNWGISGGLDQGGMLASAPQLKPSMILRGHRNERNFVGLAVRPEDGLMACGSESSCVYTYHTSQSNPLALHDMYGPSRKPHQYHHHRPLSQPATPSAYQRVCNHSTTANSQGSDGVMMAADARRRYSTSSPFVSAVAWQSASAAVALGLPPVLAAGSSAGDIKLLCLQGHLPG